MLVIAIRTSKYAITSISLAFEAPIVILLLQSSDVGATTGKATPGTQKIETSEVVRFT